MSWTVEKSRHLYNLAGWSDGYFGINARGRLVVRPGGANSPAEVDLLELAHEIRNSGLSWPVLVRCGGIIRDRLDRLRAAFEGARQRCAYDGSYTAVYPIKVNQQFEVVREIFTHGGDSVGLEAGSKPELMAVLGLSRPGGVIVCNGYKDLEYIRLALIARRLGLRVYLVVEKLSELREILRQSEELGVRPLLGVRARLASIGAGNWQNTGGDKSKFGLHSAQVLQMVAQLREQGLLDQLQLLHFHLGSQLANLKDIDNGVREAGRFFADLHALGVPVSVMDVGGGLGVDYEGTGSRSLCSMNYGLEQYADTVVGGIARICREYGLPHPEIMTESGRAMTAHHAFLITNIIDTEQAPGGGDLADLDADAPEVLVQLQRILQGTDGTPVLETHLEAAQAVADMHQMHSTGRISLAERALGEKIYYAILRKLQPRLRPSNRDHRAIFDDLSVKLADKVFCNLSIFQSLPDVWAIKQIFPIVPLQRLDEEPLQRARVEDLTCDSDGRIDLYVNAEGIENSLPLHAVGRDETYLLGFFMVGAYQEILGDMHNLFGDTDTVNLEINDDGTHRLCQPEPGDHVDELLRYVHFEPKRLRAVYRQRVNAAGLDPAQARQFLSELEAGLSGYTYHEE